MLMLIIMIVIIMTTLVPTKYYYYNNELLYQFLTKHEQLLPKKTLRPGNVPWPKHGAKIGIYWVRSFPHWESGDEWIGRSLEHPASPRTVETLRPRVMYASTTPAA